MTLWDQMLKDYVKEYKANPQNFLRQRTIAKTVHPNCNDLAVNYYNEMKQCEFCAEHVLPNLKDSPVGNPLKFSLQPTSSPMSMQHGYYLHKMKEHWGIFVPRDKIDYIVDVGGGYGNFCRHIKNFGYDGRYTIVDFPEMLDVQRSFLKHNDITNIDFEPLEMDRLLPKEGETSLLIATFSINEMPLDVRAVFEPHYNKYDYIYIAHNSHFDGVDNLKYFEELCNTLESEYNISYYKDPHRGLNVQLMFCERK